MKKRIVAILLSIVMTIPFIGCEQKSDGQLSQKEKLEDFNYMYEVIKDGYPFLEVNKRMNNVDWISNKGKYENMIKNTDGDGSFITVMTKIVEDLNNGHTEVINDKEYFEFLRDGYEKTGWYDFWNEPVVMKRYAQNCDDNSVNEKSDLKEGSTTLNKSEELVLQDILPGKVGYMYLPQMGRGEIPIEEDMKTIENYLREINEHQALVIDIRGNSGGNDAYWSNIVTMLIGKNITQNGYFVFRGGDVINNYVEAREINCEDINELKALNLPNIPEEVYTDFTKVYKRNNVIGSAGICDFKGEIYLLTDRSVYSSSESFAIFAKDTGFATLIGEVTGGDGGGIDPVIFRLPQSGLIVRMSALMYLTSSGLCNEEHKTIPDYIIEDDSMKNLRGDFSQDKCVQKVLELEGLSFDK